MHNPNKKGHHFQVRADLCGQQTHSVDSASGSVDWKTYSTTPATKGSGPRFTPKHVTAAH